MIINGIKKLIRYTSVIATVIAVPTVASMILNRYARAEQPQDFSTEKAGFSVGFKNEVCPYKVIGVFVLPEQLLQLSVSDAQDTDLYALKTPSEGELTENNKNRWGWRVPKESGLYPIKVMDTASENSMTLNVFVTVPYCRLKGEKLCGYRIGKYPEAPLTKSGIYKRPEGFIEVNEENEETLISPHFRLKQFLSKQESGYPKYLVLRERLLLKLELILEKVREEGYPAKTFQIMSGYRTPYYNKAIGNVKFSRHVYGGAADIFIDENPIDGMMDDLNRDGKSDYRDAAIIYEIIHRMCGEPWYESFIGGLGRYKRTAAHGPFVHVDVRGCKARWGY